MQALQKDFELSEEPRRNGQDWVKALPRSKDGQLQSIRIGFAPAASEGGAPQLATLEIVDSFGQQSLITFERFTLKPSLPASRFQFKPPQGASVVMQ